MSCGRTEKYRLSPEQIQNEPDRLLFNADPVARTVDADITPTDEVNNIWKLQVPRFTSKQNPVRGMETIVNQ